MPKHQYRGEFGRSMRPNSVQRPTLSSRPSDGDLSFLDNHFFNGLEAGVGADGVEVGFGV